MNFRLVQISQIHNISLSFTFLHVLLRSSSWFWLLVLSTKHIWHLNVTSSGCLHTRETNKDVPFHNCATRCAAATTVVRDSPKANAREFIAGKFFFDGMFLCEYLNFQLLKKFMSRIKGATIPGIKSV